MSNELIAPIKLDLRVENYAYNIITDYMQIRHNVMDYELSEKDGKVISLESGEWALLKNKKLYAPKEPTVSSDSGGNTSNLFFVFSGTEQFDSKATRKATVVPSHIGFIYETKKFDQTLKDSPEGTAITIGEAKRPMPAAKDQIVVGYVHSKVENGVITIRVIPH